MSDYRVSVVSPEEAEMVLARLRKGGPENKNHRRTAVLQGGIEMKGAFEITARDVASGEVAWAHKDDNLLTDFGRRRWMDYRWTSLTLGFSSSTEPPSAGRCSLASNGNQVFVSGNLTPSNNPTTHTKTISTTFGTPAANRTLGTVWIQIYNDGVNTANGFVHGMMAYALLTPPKTQTTTQTLEVVYKISMSPIY